MKCDHWELLELIYKTLCEIRDMEAQLDPLQNIALNYAAALGRCRGQAEVAIQIMDEAGVNTAKNIEAIKGDKTDELIQSR